jgi:hypothetical protein
VLGPGSESVTWSHEASHLPVSRPLRWQSLVPLLLSLASELLISQSLSLEQKSDELSWLTSKIDTISLSSRTLLFAMFHKYAKK